MLNRRTFLSSITVAGGSWSLTRRLLAAEIAYSVPGNVPSIAQANTNLCWITTAAILASWRDRTTYTPQAMASRLGSPYRELFATNTALLGRDQMAFAKVAGFRTEPPANYSIAALLKMLRTFGPLWITTSITPMKPFSAHARVLTGIFGDETLSGTDLTLVNPDGGVTQVQNYADFVTLFESLARAQQVAGADSFVVQIIHV